MFSPDSDEMLIGLMNMINISLFLSVSVLVFPYLFTAYMQFILNWMPSNVPYNCTHSVKHILYWLIISGHKGLHN